MAAGVAFEVLEAGLQACTTRPDSGSLPPLIHIRKVTALSRIVASQAQDWA